MTETFTVRFISDALNSPEYIGPFYSEDAAQDYADDRNQSLALSGIPSWVASYSVIQSSPILRQDTSTSVPNIAQTPCRRAMMNEVQNKDMISLPNPVVLAEKVQEIGRAHV